MSLLVLLVVTILLCVLNGYLAWTIQTLQTKWMRIFCEAQGIPPTSMEARPLVEEPKKEPKPRFKVSIPVPGAHLLRKN